MRRYFVWIQFLGTNFAGWQIQQNAFTVQQQIEDCLSKICRQSSIKVVGCGRTDAGVHAASYVFHVDLDRPWSPELSYSLNQLVNPDISIIHFREVSTDWHARFSARKRTYKYFIDFGFPTFNQNCIYKYRGASKELDLDSMHSAAKLLLEFDEFFPFCKSKSQVNHYKCNLYESRWEIVENRFLIYTVAANRFLRGMVRLIVGMCLRVGEGKISLGDVRGALERQERLHYASSASPSGLFLYRIDYDTTDFNPPANSELIFPMKG